MSSRTYIFYGLNAVRVLSVVALLLAFASSIVTMVSDVRAVNKAQREPNSNDGTCGYVGGSTVPDQPAGVFWAVVNRLFIIFQLVFLVLSEISWPMSFFDRFFPVLGSQFGLGSLGIFQGLIGAAILSHHVGEFTLVTAFFLFSVGCLNMMLGLIFREHAKPKRSVRIWRAGDAAGTLPMHTGDLATPKFRPSLFVGKSVETSDDDEKSNGLGFGRQGEKQAGLRGFKITKPAETVPHYAARPASQDSSLYSADPKATEPENRNTPTFRSGPTAF